MRKTTCTTSHGKIFSYWKDKCIDEKGYVHIEGEYDFAKSVEVVEDWGEPSCWCCGMQVLTEEHEEKYLEWLENDELEKIWNSSYTKKKLQRCHIIPRSISSDDSPKNLFLLCRTCHKNSPDLSNPHMFFKYIYNYKKTNYNYINEARKILQTDYNIRFAYFKLNEMKLGVNCESHCFNLEEQTKIYWVVQNTLEHRVELGVYEKMFKAGIQSAIETIKEKYRIEEKMSIEDTIKIQTYEECMTLYDTFKKIQNVEEKGRDL